MHLTLAFIGETTRKDAAIEALRPLSFPAFSFAIDKLGCFGRSGGDILWAGAGFALEKRSFSPHLTLGRRMTIPHGILGAISPEPFIQQVETISLMRSWRPAGRLVCTELYAKKLAGS